ncbi:hypothetical protein M378DRAFT_355984 [Amanita muscaria Koide BX008]|uniref:Uncharacterized protein n=1 Tax=Amanita muscaria (strain Koide BX008) TaxID=946122 RepID=A0A0C2SV66_AMAMK|nr:hypothetical protein M378DRAFT_355984 [Amanita muscaria Koide BX008]
MFNNASDAKIQGGEFNVVSGDMIKLEIKSGPDVVETVRKVLPNLLAEIRKIQSNPTADGVGVASGDYSSHPVAIDNAESGRSSLLEVRSIADRYTRTMLKCLAGYPLYDPRPYNDFTAEYLRKGVRIGDVGVVTKDGAFDFLFNVCPSKSGLINPPNLPSGSTLEKLEESDTNRKEKIQHKTRLFQTPVSRTKRLLRRPRYTSSNDGEAILELPEGASQEGATSPFPFRRLASSNGEEWYKYTIRTRGKDISNGSLYLVTSGTKCRQWGIAVFDKPCTPRESLSFVQNKCLFGTPPTKYSWKGSSIFTTKVAPSTQGDSLNQCVFMHGYKITLRQDVFDNLVNDLLRKPPSPEPERNLTQRRGPAQRIRGGAGPDPGLRVPVQDTQRRGQTTDRFILHTEFNLPPVHPSDLINSALLKENSGAKVAVTHDNDWCELVKDIFENLEHSQSLDLAKIAQSYCTSPIDQYGCISFEKIPESRKSLVIAIDIGTTFSGVSYSLLEPGKAPRIQPVTRYSIIYECLLWYVSHNE